VVSDDRVLCEKLMMADLMNVFQNIQTLT